MKTLLYFEGRKLFDRSGIGRAYRQQKRALEYAGIEVTTNVKAKDYDVVHINTYGANSLNMIRKAKKLGKKVIIYAHSTQEDFQNSFVGSNTLSPLYKKYLISFYTQADVIIAPTEYSKFLLLKYGITTPISVISNGVNLPKYQPNAMKEKAFRDVFDIKKGEKVVVGIGLFFERKGIIDFIEVARRMPHVRFIWFGHTPKISIPPRIQKILKGAPENIEFPGFIRDDILEGGYSGSDAFFFPSYEENEGIVVLEALASKQKVLIRDIPAYTPWLEDGKNCLKASDNKEFEEKLNYILENPLTDMKQSAYETAQQKSIPEVSKKIQEVYQRLFARRI